ncbi:UNVERIFIED_CONTAM: hypothetical protein RMT77_017562 [Armadillidium vulgare]
MDFVKIFQRCQDLRIDGKGAKELIEKMIEREERQKEREERQREREEKQKESEREERRKDKEALEREKERKREIRMLKLRLGLTIEPDESIEELHSENSFSQTEIPAEKETSSSQDLFSQTETFTEREVTSSRDMSTPPELSEQGKYDDEVSSSSSEIVHSRISIPKCESVDTRETEERGCSVETNISYETESQIGQPRTGMLEFELEIDVEFNMFDRKSTTEEKEEEHERDLTVTTSKDHSLHNEERTIKSLHTNSYSSYDIGRDSRTFPFQNETDNGNFQKYSTGNQSVKTLNQQGIKNKKFDIHVSPNSVRTILTFLQKKL